jgi:hypothetical protein
MSRLTRCDGRYLYGNNYYSIIPDPSLSVSECIDKLGKLEDILEEYGIEDLTDLKIALDYYNNRFDGLHTERVDKDEQH